MIKTATQLKAKVRNLSGSDSQKAQTLIRNFIMERFLERVALSRYRNNFILKGGMLVAAVVGLETRATKDIDTTVHALNLTKDNASRIVEEIIAVEIPDGVGFHITKVMDIMDEHDYPGIRFMLEARLDTLRQTIQIDISTGDVITPAAVEYAYPLMFEDRAILLWTYNLETLQVGLPGCAGETGKRQNHFPLSGLEADRLHDHVGTEGTQDHKQCSYRVSGKDGRAGPPGGKGKTGRNESLCRRNVSGLRAGACPRRRASFRGAPDHGQAARAGRGLRSDAGGIPLAAPLQYLG